MCRYENSNFWGNIYQILKLFFNKLSELKLQLGYKFDEWDIDCKDPNLFNKDIEPENIEIKDKKMVDLFETIIDYLEEEQLREKKI